jgi:hypothetical protein
VRLRLGLASVSGYLDATLKVLIKR